MRVLRLAPDEFLDRHRGRRAASASSATSTCTRSAATSRSRTSSADRAILSLHRPRRAPGRRPPARCPPSTRHREDGRAADRRHRPRARPDRPRELGRGGRSPSCATRGAAEVTEEAAEIARVEAGRPRFGAEMSDGDDAGRGRDHRARGQLHEGLLHRPGAGRPASLQGQAQPPPARPAAQRRGRRRRPDPPRRARGRARRHRRASPPPAARSRSRSCAARPSPATPSRSATDGAEAEVVELPF